MVSKGSVSDLDGDERAWLEGEIGGRIGQRELRVSALGPSLVRQCARPNAATKTGR